MKIRFFLAFLLLLLTAPAPLLAKHTLKVGIYNNNPLIYQDEDGSASGLYIEILKEIAKKANWELLFIKAPWEILLEQLREGDIDLLPVVAYTEKRAEIFDFNSETIIANWAEIYSSMNASFSSILDLEGKRIAVKMGDVHLAALKELTAKFNVSCRFIEADEYTTIFEMLHAGYLDVGVVNRMFGRAKRNDFNLRLTPIIFNPIEVRFAATKDLHKDILTVLDTYLVSYKNNSESIYYEALERWLMVEQTSRTPRHIQYLLFAVMGFLLLMLAVSGLLRYQVSRQTRALSESNLHLKEEINKRQKAMMELKKYARVVEASSDAIALFDKGDNHLLVNESYLRTFGYDRDELQNRSLKDVIGSDFYEEYLKEAIKNCLRGKQSNIIARHDPEHERRKYWHIHLGPYTVSGGYIHGYAIDIRDITEQKKLENKLKHAQKMEAIGILAGGVAHDLNNILSGIVSYPDMLLVDREPADPMYTPLQTMKKSGEKAAAIVTDLLTLARRGVDNRQTTNLNIIVREFLVSPEYQKLKEPYELVKVTTVLDKELLNVEGSPVHLSKCLMNLFTNGLEAIEEEGTLTIATENRYIEEKSDSLSTIAPGEYTALEVTDTGVGMSEEAIQHIFEPFYTSKVMGRSGTGLGMTLVWNSVQDHAGYITVSSTPGAGTTFTLFFPATRKEMTDGSSENIDDFKGAGESVLVIDDIEEQRRFASEILAKLGYSPSSVKSGEEAVERIREENFDILILDMIMPGGMNGLETYEAILDQQPGQKAIIASGFSDTASITRTQELGARQHVKKPYTVLSLASALKKELHPDGEI